MANTSHIIDVDLKEFARQKQLVTKHATEQVAQKIEQIKALVLEINDLKEISGIYCDVEQEIYYAVRGWNSSDC